MTRFLGWYVSIILLFAACAVAQNGAINDIQSGEPAMSKRIAQAKDGKDLKDAKGAKDANIAAEAGNPASSSKKVKLLAIGNSLSVNATKYLKQIVASSGGCELVFGHAMIGGCSMEKHYNLAIKHEESPDDPQGKPYTFNGKKSGLKEMLTAEKWDFVTIQQLSTVSHKIESYRPSAKNLSDYIKKYAPQAEIVIHQTWAYRPDDTLIYVKGYTQEKMYQDLTKAYHTIARELGGLKVIPCGDAFQLAQENDDWKYKPDPNFDYKKPPYPALPKEPKSLYIGYKYQTTSGTHKLSLDMKHASPAGEYLGGCVWYEFFFKEDARKLTYRPDAVTEKDAVFLRDIAHKVVTEGAKPQGWPLK
ncbi:MAG: DUF4886 domain-containing protein [Candidatus Sumerlaeota bacterium]|nr:DUF4886 domain-containing protein [Candidatus Sumerlaeota bacterium]